jgi:hypothetical protein
VKKHRVVAIVASLACAAAGAVLPSTGCGGSGFTPVCTFEDGAINAEAGCGTPVEASALENDSSNDSPEDQGNPASDDAPDDTNPPPDEDASDAGHEDADAHVADAHEDGHIQDAHSDSKG